MSTETKRCFDAGEESLTYSGDDDDNEQSKVSQSNYCSVEEQAEQEISQGNQDWESLDTPKEEKALEGSSRNTEEEWVAGTFMDDEDFESTVETNPASALDDGEGSASGFESIHEKEEDEEEEEVVVVPTSEEDRGEFSLEASLDTLHMDVELSQRAPPPPPTAPSLGLELGTSAPAGSGLPASPFSVAWIRGSSRSSSVAPGEMRTSKWLRARRELTAERSDSFSNQMHPRET